MSFPKEIEEALASLSESESKHVKEYITSLHDKIKKLGGSVESDDDGCCGGGECDDEPKTTEEEMQVEDDGITVPQYESGEDYENQSELKMKAADSKSAGNLEEALESYNGAVLGNMLFNRVVSCRCFNLILLPATVEICLSLLFSLFPSTSSSCRR